MSRNTAGDLLEMQSSQVMGVVDGNKTEIEGSYGMWMYIAASGQLHPLRMKPRMELT